MGHSEIAQAPGKGGNNGYQGVVPGSPGSCVIALDKAQIAGEAAGIFYHRVPATGGINTKYHHNNQRQSHNHRLHHIRNGCGQEAAEDSVCHNYTGGDYHSRKILHTKQAGEQRTTGIEAGGSIGNKENNNDNRGNKGQKMIVVMVASGKEVRNRNRTQAMAVTPNPFCNKPPVQIRADRKPNGRPHRLG